MQVIIGAPVYKRAWILHEWFNAIGNQDFPLSKIGFVFEAGPGDEDTLDCLLDFAASHTELICFDININRNSEHQEHVNGVRRWRKHRYVTMVNFRNNILDRVICRNPDRYFSLDTDIILEDPQTISKLVNLTASLDAVSPLAYMGPDNITFPNVMSWVGNGFAYRSKDYPIGSLFKADIIMAAVMMSKKVYQNVRYDPHQQGEDLGWSTNAQVKGFELYCSSDLYCPHLMSEQMLIDYKKSGDPRKSLLEKKVSLS